MSDHHRIDTFLRDNSETLAAELNSDIALDLQIDPALWPIRADRTQFMAVLICLLHNARDAMVKEGRVLIAAKNIEAADIGDQGQNGAARHVMIEVSDTGAGVPDVIIDRVFEPFFTKHGMATATGLGLSRAYGFAKQSGGSVTIENNPGGGATVRLTMPSMDQA